MTGKSPFVSAICAALLASAPAVATAQAAPPQTSPPQTSPPASASADQARWGALAELAGRDFATIGTAYGFRWLEPGRTMAIHVAYLRNGQQVGNTAIVSLANNGVELRYDDPATKSATPWHARVAPDGSLSLDFGQGRFRPWFVRDKRGWSLYGTHSLTVPPDGELAGALARITGGKGIPATPTTPAVAAGSPAGATAPGAPMTDAMKAGFAAMMARAYRHGDIIVTYRMLADGRVAVVGTPSTAEFALDAQGLPVSTWRDDKGMLNRGSYVPDATGYQLVRETSKTKPGKPPNWKPLSRSSYVALTPTERDQGIATNIARRKAQWSPLAHLADGPVGCIQYEPGFMLTRQYKLHPYGRPLDRTFPVMRLTSAQWVRQYEEMLITSTFGDGRVMKDRVALRADGAFVMDTSGVGGRTSLVGVLQSQRFGPAHTQQTLRFPIYDFMGNGEKYQSAMVFDITQFEGRKILATTRFEPWGHGPGDGSCIFLDRAGNQTPLDQLPADLLAASREVANSMQSDRDYWTQIAQDRTDGAAMVAGMRGELLGTIAQIPGAIAGVQQQQVQLNRLRAAAEQETAMKRAAQVATASRPAAPGGTPATSARQAGATGQPAAPRRAATVAAARPAAPQATMRVYAWCWATVGAEAVYQSGVGSRTMAAQEVPIEAWRSELVAQFRRALPKPVDTATCNVDRDGNFSYLQGEMPRAVRVPWTPS